MERIQARPVHIDFGTGDGAFVRRTARLRPDLFLIGLDAVSDNLQEASRLVARKPARGGADNALFGRLPLEEAPGDLEALADALTVLLPWGSLLRALAQPDPQALERLRRLCKPSAQVRFVFGYDPAVDGGSIDGFALPPLDDPAWPQALARFYRDLGFAVKARALPAAGLRALPTTWAQKLSQAGRQRRFLDLCGEVVG